MFKSMQSGKMLYMMYALTFAMFIASVVLGYVGVGDMKQSMAGSILFLASLILGFVLLVASARKMSGKMKQGKTFALGVVMFIFFLILGPLISSGMNADNMTKIMTSSMG